MFLAKKCKERHSCVDFVFHCSVTSPQITRGWCKFGFSYWVNNHTSFIFYTIFFVGGPKKTTSLSTGLDSS